MRKILIVDDNVELAGLLAVTVEARGFAAQIAHTGKDAFAFIEASPPDAAVVDLLLPDVRGSEVLKELASKRVPSLAISGVFRGDRFAREAVSLWGARAFFEKPFAMEALLDALAGLLGQELTPNAAVEELSLEEDAEEELTQPPTTVEQLPAEAMDELPQDLVTSGIFATPPPPPPSDPRETVPAPPTEPVRVGAAALLDEGLLAADARRAAAARAEALRQVPGQSSPAAPPKPPAPTTATPVPAAPKPADAPDPFAWKRSEVWRPRERPVRLEHAPWTRAGNLATTSVARLLTAFYQGQQTGELRVRRNSVVKLIAVERGIPVYAASNVGTERFAPMAVRAGKLSKERLDFVKNEAQTANMRTGDALVALGLISEADRLDVLVRQVKEIIWSTLDWSEGEYAFALGQSRKDVVKLSVFPGDLLLEGFRRSRSLLRLRELVPAATLLFPTQDPPYPLEQLKLSGGQALLLAYADGAKTVEDLLMLSDLDEREALATLHGFVQLGILAPRASEKSRQKRIVLV